MTTAVTVISSMATRQILDALLADFQRAGLEARVLSIGGVDAAKRVRAGDVFDVVVLAADALQALAAEGHVISNSLRTFARSPTALAVPAGAPRPANCNEAAIRSLVATANRIALSTGPSGVNVMRMLETWAVPDLARRLVRAPPGVPVARLLARGDADIGFQQLSELRGEPNIDIVGSLPDDLQPMTIFACGIGSQRTDTTAAQTLMRVLLSEAAAVAKRQHSMEPAE